MKDFLKFFAFLSIAILLIVLAFRGIRFQTIITQISNAKLLWVFLSFLVSVFALISRAYRWNLLIEPLNYRPFLRNTFYAVSIGYFANLALPRLGEVTRCGSLNKTSSIPFNKLLGTVITERLVDLLSLVICLCITFIIEFERLGNFMINNIIQPITSKVGFVFKSRLLIFFGILLIGAVGYFLFRYFRSGKNSGKSKDKLFGLAKGVLSGIISIRSIKRPWLFVFHSIAIWVLYYLGVYLALFALPTTANLGLRAALFLLVAGGIGMSAPVQGGIGAYHLLVSQGLMLYGLSKEDGLAFATLLHSLQLVMILFFGGVSLIAIFIEKNQRNKTKAIQQVTKEPAEID